MFTGDEKILQTILRNINANIPHIPMEIYDNLSARNNNSCQTNASVSATCGKCKLFGILKLFLKMLIIINIENLFNFLVKTQNGNL